MNVWNITAKDLSLLLRDRRTFAILLLLPLLFIMIIGMTTGRLLGWKSSNQVLKVAVIDNTDYNAIGSAEFLKTDETPSPQPLSANERASQRRIASHLVVDIYNGIQRTPGIEIRTIDDWLASQNTSVVAASSDPESIGRELLNEGDVNALLIFQPDFYRQIYHLEYAGARSNDDNAAANERFAQLGMRVETRNPNSSTASAISAVIGVNVMDVLNPLITCRSLNATIAERRSARYRNYCGPVDAMARTKPDEPLDPASEQNEDSGTSAVYDDLVPSYTVMFVFFLVNIMARSFLTERELGTLRRLRIAPISGTAILLGKTLPFLLISLIQTGVLFGAGRLLFGMSWGSHPVMLLPIIFTTSAAATGLGLLIATLVKSDSQVSAYATTAVIVLAGISGCFMPRDWLPELMQQISLGTPHAWALIAYDELLNQPTPDMTEVWQCAGMLALFAVGFFIAGAWRFKSDN